MPAAGKAFTALLDSLMPRKPISPRNGQLRGHLTPEVNKSPRSTAVGGSWWRVSFSLN